MQHRMLKFWKTKIRAANFLCTFTSLFVEDGLSFITSSKATEAITFHDKQSAERMLEFIDATITGIKTTIVKVGRYER